jgi:hypothetical protein
MSPARSRRIDAVEARTAPLSPVTFHSSTTRSRYLLAVLIVKSESEMREDYYNARIESAECRSCT